MPHEHCHSLPRRVWREQENIKRRRQRLLPGGRNEKKGRNEEVHPSKKGNKQNRKKEENSPFPPSFGKKMEQVLLPRLTIKARAKWWKNSSSKKLTPLTQGTKTVQAHGELAMEQGKVPVYSLRGTRDLGSPTAQAARHKLTPDSRTVFDFFVDVVRRLEIHLFERTLRREQLSFCTVVTNIVQWDEVADRFQDEVDLYRFITFDVEKFLPHPDSRKKPRSHLRRVDQERVLYAHFATLTGRTVIFDLEEMYGGPVPEDDPLEPLPLEFKSWIASETILVAGAAVRDDVLEVNWRGAKLVNTIEVFRSNMAGPKPLVNIGSTNKPGLGTQSFYAKSFNYKPMARKEFEELYGPHQYRTEEGQTRWPRSRNKFFLYQWPKVEGKLIQECVFYMWHDATVPVALVARLVVDRCLRGGADFTDMTTSTVVETTLAAKYSYVEAADYLLMSAIDEEGIADETVDPYHDEIVVGADGRAYLHESTSWTGRDDFEAAPPPKKLKTSIHISRT